MWACLLPLQHLLLCYSLRLQPLVLLQLPLPLYLGCLESQLMLSLLFSLFSSLSRGLFSSLSRGLRSCHPLPTQCLAECSGDEIHMLPHRSESWCKEQTFVQNSGCSDQLLATCGAPTRSRDP